jgi:hypothetical protein
MRRASLHRMRAPYGEKSTGLIESRLTLGQRRWCMRENEFTERLHKRVSRLKLRLFGATQLTSHRYFPTVYEPTVFENYVHGKH